MNTKYFKSALYTSAMALFCAAMSVSCTADDIVAGKGGNGGDFQDIYQNSIIVNDGESAKATNAIELYESGNYTTTLKISLTKPVSVETSISLGVDAAYIEEYNKEHGTSYEAYPAEGVEFENGGTVTFAPGAQTAELAMTVKKVEIPSTVADVKKDYMIAVGVQTNSSELALKHHCIYTVADMTNLKTCFKGDDLPKGFLYFEVNDCNPLNALAFELEDGRLLWDVVVLFAANINHHNEENRPYLKCNENVQFLLDHNEEFLQPLRKRGIKVLLGILGNHDQAGLCQMSEKGNKVFAAELAQYCKAYNLDGVNFDDEYSKEPDLSNPFYAPKGYNCAASLCYETKQAMPDKLVTVYDLSYMYLLPEWKGVDVDNWIDIVVADYGGESQPLGDMSKMKCSGLSMEFARGGWYGLNAETARQLKEDGFGWFMGFAPDPINHDNGQPKFENSFDRLYGGPKELYGSDLKKPTFFYRKNDTKRYVYPDDILK